MPDQSDRRSGSCAMMCSHNPFYYLAKIQSLSFRRPHCMIVSMSEMGIHDLQTIRDRNYAALIETTYTLRVLRRLRHLASTSWSGVD